MYTIEYAKDAFCWNEEKNHANYRRHRVWFEEALAIWADESAVEFFDPDHSTDEERYIRVGYSRVSRLLLVVGCERDEGETIRVISARKATKNERSQYEEGI